MSCSKNFGFAVIPFGFISQVLFSSTHLIGTSAEMIKIHQERMGDTLCFHISPVWNANINTNNPGVT